MNCRPDTLDRHREGIAASDEALSLSLQLPSEAERQEPASTIREYKALIEAYLLAQ
jgi:hypothetical protein